MPTTEYVLSTPAWLADHRYPDHNTGRQIDWDAVPGSFANANGKKVVRSGTVMAQLPSGKVVPRASTTETATGLLIGTAIQDNPALNRSMHGMVIGGHVYRNLLSEGASGSLTGWLAEINLAGPGLSSEVYQDTRLS